MHAKYKAKKRAQWIDTCKSLLRYYQGKSPKAGDTRDWKAECYVCALATDKRYASVCDGCVWMRCAGMTCHNFLYTIPKLGTGNYTPSDLRIARKLEWRMLRIKQLKKWIKILQRGKEV